MTIGQRLDLLGAVAVANVVAVAGAVLFAVAVALVVAAPRARWWRLRLRWALQRHIRLVHIPRGYLTDVVRQHVRKAAVLLTELMVVVPQCRRAHAAIRGTAQRCDRNAAAGSKSHRARVVG